MRAVADIDLKLLRIFVAIVEAGGFSLAQASLGLTASTISIRMKELERRVGFTLCERGRKGFRLTSRGRLVFEESRQLIALVDGFASKVGKFRSELSGSLSLGVVDALATNPLLSLAKVIREFSQSADRVFIDLKVASRPQLEPLVLSGQIDAAIGPFTQSYVGLRRRSLFVEEHSVYCGRDHPLFDVAGCIGDVAAIADHAVVARAYCEEFDLNRFGPVQVLSSTDSMEGVLTLILSGLYIGYLPTHFADYWVKRGDMRPIANRKLGYRSQHAVLTRAHKEQPLLLAFETALLRQANKK
jgi:DNA-binding transcriptional LysR family regulator